MRPIGSKKAAYVSSSSLSIEDLDRLYPTAQFVHVVTQQHAEIASRKSPVLHS